MARRRRLVPLALTGIIGASGCATILGLDDLNPRQAHATDSGVTDATDGASDASKDAQIWLTTFGGARSAGDAGATVLIQAMTLTPSGAIFIGGKVSGEAVLGPGVQPSTIAGEPDGGNEAFIAELRGDDGTFLHAKVYGGLGDTGMNALSFARDGRLYATFGFQKDLRLGPDEPDDKDHLVHVLALNEPDERAYSSALASFFTTDDSQWGAIGTPWDTRKSLGTQSKSVTLMPTIAASDNGVTVLGNVGIGEAELMDKTLTPPAGGTMLFLARTSDRSFTTLCQNADCYATGLATTPQTTYVGGKVRGDLGVGDAGATDAGAFYEAFVAALDPASFDAKWVKRLEGNGAQEVIAVARVANTDDVVAVGTFQDEIHVDGYTKKATGADDLFVARFDGNGNAKWLIAGGGDGRERATRVAVDKAERVYVAGMFDSSRMTNLGGESLENHGGSDGETDIFVLVLDAAGKHVFSTALGGGRHDEVNGIAVNDEKGTFVIAGSFATNLRIADGIGRDAVGTLDGFIATLRLPPR